MRSAYHAPLGVVWFAGCIIMHIFPVKLSVVHISFLHNLERGNEAEHRARLELYLNIEERLTFMSPAIPGSLQLLW